MASLEGADGYRPTITSWGPEWQLGLNDAQSAFLQRLGCTSGRATRATRSSIEEAQYELSRNGRGNVQDVIIFMSDGAANTWPDEPAGRALVEQPDASATAHAGPAFSRRHNIKAGGTVIYTIGYDLDAGSAAPGTMHAAAEQRARGGSTPEQCGTWGCTAYDAIRAMAMLAAELLQQAEPR